MHLNLLSFHIRIDSIRIEFFASEIKHEQLTHTKNVSHTVNYRAVCCAFLFIKKKTEKKNKSIQKYIAILHTKKWP